MRNTDILIVDDEIGIREVLQETLEDEGYTVALAENAEEARCMRNQMRPAMVLLDIWMPDSDGITLLKEWAKNGQLNMPVVMMSGHGSIDTAVEATKIGALDFLEKPIPLQKLLATVERALKYSEIQNNQNFNLDNLGKTEAIKTLQKQVENARKLNGSVLIIGELGSPFETIARTFHRPNTPWVTPSRPEHIADMPNELLNQSTNGIVFLGDITQYGKHLQQHIGFLVGKAERHNARVICTSSMPISDLLATQQCDAQILSLLSSSVITIPPLRHQSEDLEFLVKQVLAELSQNQGLPEIQFSKGAMAKMRQYSWPGNLEQLKNIVNSLALNAEGSEISERDVALILNQFEPGSSQAVAEITDGFNFDLPLRELREQLERRYFEYHIRQENGNMSRVALKVGLERTHLYRKLKQLNITFNRRNDKD